MRDSIPSSLDAQHDITVSEFGRGVDIGQNGISIHVGHDQLLPLIYRLAAIQLFEEIREARV